MAMLILLVIGFIVGVVFTQTTRTGSVKPVIITTACGLLIGLFFSMIRVVPAGYVGVVDLFGRVSLKPLSSGLNLVNPLARVVMMSIRTQEETEVIGLRLTGPLRFIRRWGLFIKI
jgi:regulator of protease activity HflC (stomatin/prohibitin superfamily)